MRPLLLLILLTCYTQLAKAQLEGTYIFRDGFGSSSLQLNKNSTYTHTTFTCTGSYEENGTYTITNNTKPIKFYLTPELTDILISTGRVRKLKDSVHLHVDTGITNISAVYINDGKKLIQVYYGNNKEGFGKKTTYDKNFSKQLVKEVQLTYFDKHTKQGSRTKTKVLKKRENYVRFFSPSIFMAHAMGELTYTNDTIRTTNKHKRTHNMEFIKSK